ncbi:hypothetical protein [Mucilaginibacter dorajii]|uniref:Uncharacterized protein n=1 Tax=Mucilaginibacter dorajii TaxID=692994 RepID=A0ABP7PPW7_9SPHI|nr:hypothetical protein [Mucilaginibacter dorajii]MCS3736910.1 hypothetical protein [Mucilaginibacter dorajii]
MKSAALCIFIIITLNASAQTNCDPRAFKKLISFSKKHSLSDKQFTSALLIVKKLELGNCSYYEVKTKGINYQLASLTELLGNICIKTNTPTAVNEYVLYMKRHSTSAEEQMAFSFEQIFVKQPAYVLAAVGQNTALLDQLEWGVVNNQPNIKLNNYKTAFYSAYPALKQLYPKYKKQVDYLLNAIAAELKG